MSKLLTIAMGVMALFLVAGCQPPGPSGGSTATYTVSGTVGVANNTFTDSDINDVYATDYTTPNNDSGTAQAIANPAVVGGYVNDPYAGDSYHGGNSYVVGDIADYYSVSLKSGDKINLYIADAAETLYLYLYASDGSTVVASSTGSTQVQTVTAPSAADYFVAVKTSGGGDASNYTLAVGVASITAVGANFTADDFAPGEILVRFKDSAQSAAGVQTQATIAERTGLQIKSGTPDRVMLMDLGDSTQRKQAARSLGFQATSPGQVADTTARLKQDTKKAVQALRRRSDVQSADLNYRRRAMADPTDPNYGSQWDLPMMELPVAWDDTTRGSGAVVAVIDTGVLLGHPDLAGQFSADGGYDFISDPNISNDGDGIDLNPDDPGDKVPPQTRSSFHGTHVAGTIAAITCFTLPSPDCASGTAAGVAGIAPHAKIMPLRVLGQGGGYDSDIIQAMYYAADLANNSGMTPSSRGGQRADIINMSLGGGSYSTTFQSAVDQVYNAGVIIIAAAGNSSTSTPSYPAAYNHVVSVSAVGPTKTLAYYSNYGSTIDVTAPGGDQSTIYSNGILSTLGDDSSGSIVNTYGFYQGTSMAAPHVAGVAALMKAYKGSLTPSEFDTYLQSGNITEDLGTVGKDNQYGWGLINAKLAVAAAGVPLDIPPVMDPDKALVDFGGISTQPVTVTVKNGSLGVSAGDVTGVSITTDGSSWLSTGSPSSTTITTSTPITFDIGVDRTGLADGYYTGTVTLSASNASSVAIQVTMYKGSIVGDAGYQYITLINVNNTNPYYTPQQIAASRDPATGSYSFSFSNVGDGEYYIVSGTDMDNDYVICDAGESCGAYPDIGSFTVSGGNVSGIHFTTGYYVPSAAASLSTGSDRSLMIQRKASSGKQVPAP